MAELFAGERCSEAILEFLNWDYGCGQEGPGGEGDRGGEQRVGDRIGVPEGQVRVRFVRVVERDSLGSLSYV